MSRRDNRAAGRMGRHLAYACNALCVLARACRSSRLVTPRYNSPRAQNVRRRVNTPSASYAPRALPAAPRGTPPAPAAHAAMPAKRAFWRLASLIYCGNNTAGLSLYRASEHATTAAPAAAISTGEGKTCERAGGWLSSLGGVDTARRGYMPPAWHSMWQRPTYLARTARTAHLADGGHTGNKRHSVKRRGICSRSGIWLSLLHYRWNTGGGLQDALT